MWEVLRISYKGNTVAVESSESLPFTSISGKRLLIFTLLVMAILPVAILLTSTYRVVFVPFDAETLSRFIKPFMFQENDNFIWTVTESCSYGIVRPLYNLSFLADYSLWQGDFRFYHVTDILLTWVTYILAYFLFQRRFGRFTAAIAVTLWAFLPAQSQSLVTMMGRNDRILLLTLLCSFFMYDRSIVEMKSKKKWLLLTLLVFSSGILAKESVFYYSLYLFAWSIIAAGRTFIETLKEDALLWGGIGVVAILYFLLRISLGIPFGDDTVIETGVRYLSLLGTIIMWGIPFELPAIPSPIIGLISFPVAGVMLFSRKIPSDIRYGLFCLFVGFFHLPLFWIQHCFLWLPWLWGSLALAGILVAILRKATVLFGGSGRLAGFMLIALSVVLTLFWTRSTIENLVHKRMVFDYIITYLIDNSEDQTYDGRILYSDIDGFAEMIGDRDRNPNVRMKQVQYLQDLLQVRLRDPDVRIQMPEYILQD